MRSSCAALLVVTPWLFASGGWRAFDRLACLRVADGGVQRWVAVGPDAQRREMELACEAFRVTAMRYPRGLATAADVEKANGRRIAAVDAVMRHARETDDRHLAWQAVWAWFDAGDHLKPFVTPEIEAFLQADEAARDVELAQRQGERLGAVVRGVMAVHPAFEAADEAALDRVADRVSAAYVDVPATPVPDDVFLELLADAPGFFLFRANLVGDEQREGIALTLRWVMLAAATSGERDAEHRAETRAAWETWLGQTVDDLRSHAGDDEAVDAVGTHLQVRFDAFFRVAGGNRFFTIFSRPVHAAEWDPSGEFFNGEPPTFLIRAARSWRAAKDRGDTRPEADESFVRFADLAIPGRTTIYAGNLTPMAQQPAVLRYVVFASTGASGENPFDIYQIPANPVPFLPEARLRVQGSAADDGAAEQAR